MLRKRGSLWGLEQVGQDRSEGFPVLWVQSVGALIAVAVGVVTVNSAGLSPVWATLLLALAVLLILGLAAPTILRALRRGWTAWRHASRLRGLWTSFRHEVDERRWLYVRMHAHSLPALLVALRATPVDDESRFRLRALQVLTATEIRVFLTF